MRHSLTGGLYWTLDKQGAGRGARRLESFQGNSQG